MRHANWRIYRAEEVVNGIGSTTHNTGGEFSNNDDDDDDNNNNIFVNFLNIPGE